MNWLEAAAETALFEQAHAEMHQVGELLRSNFEDGCRLGPDTDGNFAHTCPVSLAHKRYGLSPGFTGNMVCSICYEDASECAHVPGDSYDVEACLKPWCNVCGDDRCQIHSPGERFQAVMGTVVTEATLHEISWVGRPAQPDARVRSWPISEAQVEATVGQLPAGAYLKCDRCLGPCPGFETMEDAR